LPNPALEKVPERVPSGVIGTPEEEAKEVEALELAEVKLVEGAVSLEGEKGTGTDTDRHENERKDEEEEDKGEEAVFDPIATAAAATAATIAAATSRRRLLAPAAPVIAGGGALRANGEVIGTDVWICRGSEYVNPKF
jgi:hypothetical protein